MPHFERSFILHPVLIASTAFFTPIFTVISPKGFVILFAILTIALAMQIWIALKWKGETCLSPDLFNREATVFWLKWILALGVLFLIGNLNAADHIDALKRTVHTLGAIALIPVFTTGLRLLDEQKKRLMLQSFLWGGIVASVILVFIGFGYFLGTLYPATVAIFDLPSHSEFNRQLIFLVFFNALAMWHAVHTEQYRLAIPLFFLTGIATFLSTSESAKLAIVVMTVSYFLVTWWPKLAVWAISIMLVAIGWTLPWTAGLVQKIAATSPTIVEGAAKYQALHNSLARLEIWTAAGDRITERPLLGWGIDGIKHYGLPTLRGDFFNVGYVHHAHNGPIHAWIDFGIFGPICFSVAILLLAKFLTQTENFAKKFMVAIAFAALSVFYVGYGLFETWWICLLGYVFAMSILLAGREPNRV